jgi:hypothetical protein
MIRKHQVDHEPRKLIFVIYAHILQFHSQYKVNSQILDQSCCEKNISLNLIQQEKLLKSIKNLEIEVKNNYFLKNYPDDTFKGRP